MEEETDVTTDRSTREIVLDILLEVLEEGQLSHLVLKQALEKYQYLEKQDRAFITRLTEGTLEYLIRIDAVIGRFSKVPVKKMKPVIREILRMSVYQILFMERVPDSAACNEAVKLAKKRRFQGLTGFVNGVLRNVAREKEKLVFEEPSEKYSIPAWMLSLWEKSCGKERAEQIASAFLTERPVTVRCNESRCTVSEMKNRLAAQGIQAEDTEFSPAVLSLRGYDYLDAVDEFRDGLLMVQDPSSALVGLVASPKPDSFVLDVCSAPGGKALHIADLMRGTGLVEARDLTEYKISLVEENIERCGFTNVRTRVWDASVFDPDMEEKADLVIADLPCSGLGIIGKKPDIKFRLKKEELSELSRLQKEILGVIVRYVKPGGILIYSTCTINRLENEDNADWIENELKLSKLDLRERLPECLREECDGNRIQILPGLHQADGFFIAAFQKVK